MCIRDRSITVFLIHWPATPIFIFLIHSSQCFVDDPDYANEERSIEDALEVERVVAHKHTDAHDEGVRDSYLTTIGLLCQFGVNEQIGQEDSKGD